MKRWIHAATDINPFKTDTTNTSYYDSFLNDKDLQYLQKAKNLTGHIEMMSPEEYFQECADNIFKGKASVSDLKRQREVSKDPEGAHVIEKYKDQMLKGMKFPMCFLNYANAGQEGLHRMYAAGEAFGWDTRFPVLVVEPYDQDKWDRAEVESEIRYYLKYDFKHTVTEVADSISDRDSPVPDNLSDILKDEIGPDDDSYDIKVDVDVTDSDAIVRLTQFNGIEVDPEISKMYEAKIPLDYMFDTGQEDEFNIDEEIEDMDLEDIESFFFKN